MNCSRKPKGQKKFLFCKEFSPLPGGRRKVHGPHSGEEFRERILIPLIEEYEFIEFVLTGAEGFASGFLDEAFGEVGTIIGLNEASRRLTFTAADDPFVVEMIWDKIKNADAEQKGRG